MHISIFAQANITNPTSWLVKLDVLIKLLYSPTSEYNKIEIFKMAASRFVEVTDKEKSEIRLSEYSPIITSPSANNC
jgi:hypothetical protein